MISESLGIAGTVMGREVKKDPVVRRSGKWGVTGDLFEPLSRPPPPPDSARVRRAPLTPDTGRPALGPGTRPTALLPGAGTGRPHRPRTIDPECCLRDCSSR